VTLFAGSAAVLVHAYGLIGYGLAEFVALTAYVLLHRATRQSVSFSYTRAIPWILAFVPPLFAPLVPWPWSLLLLLAIAPVALSPPARRQLGEYFTVFKGGLGQAAR
jgi:hypothetical protein